MEKKKLATIGIFAALVLVCGLSALTVFGSLAWMGRTGLEFRIFDVELVSAEVTSSETYDASRRLEILSDAGDISVTAADVEAIEVEMVKKAWASDEAEAQAAAEALQVNVRQSLDTLSFVYEEPATVGIVGSRGGRDHVHFTVLVPENIEVELRTNSGEVELTGTVGNAEVETHFGDIRVQDLAGGLWVESANADIFIERIDAGGETIDVRNAFGKLDLHDVTVQDLLLESSNGDIEVGEVAVTGELEIMTTFGSIQVSDLAAETILIDNRNGRIRLENGEVSSNLTVSNQFGDVIVLGVEAGSYDLKTSNGQIEVDGAAGRLDLANSFGNITVRNAVQAALNIQASNGQIDFSGSLDPKAKHTLETSFGDIRLTLPDDSAFDLKLETTFGRISSEIPVTLIGSLEDNPSSSSWDATINGGGPQLEATSSNGDIVIAVLAGQ